MCCIRGQLHLSVHGCLTRRSPTSLSHPPRLACWRLLPVCLLWYFLSNLKVVPGAMTKAHISAEVFTESINLCWPVRPLGWISLVTVAKSRGSFMNTTAATITLGVYQSINLKATEREGDTLQMCVWEHKRKRLFCFVCFPFLSFISRLL